MIDCIIMNERAAPARDECCNDRDNPQRILMKIEIANGDPNACNARDNATDDICRMIRYLGKHRWWKQRTTNLIIRDRDRCNDKTERQQHKKHITKAVRTTKERIKNESEKRESCFGTCECSECEDGTGHSGVQPAIAV